jgi:phage terminase large subunit GpA-like protein
MGKTDFILNVIGQRMDDDPVPIGVMTPTEKLVKSISKDRFTKMVKSVPSLYKKLSKGKDTNLYEKFIAGVRLGFHWAGSPTEASSHSYCIAFIDELDRTSDLKGEGDLAEVFEARISNFPDGKLILTTTPTESGKSPSWNIFKESTMFGWSWPCPHCNEYFLPCLKILKWPEKCKPKIAKRLAYIECPHCAEKIENKHKQYMNKNGLPLAYEVDGEGFNLKPLQKVVDGEIVGEGVESDIAGFWMSGLCSPWKTFGERAQKFVRAARSGNIARVQGVINTDFGELFEIKGDAPEWKEVAKLRQEYPEMEVPQDAGIILSSVDVQENRLVYATRAYGAKAKSWLIDAGEIYGNTNEEAPFKELEEKILKGRYYKQDLTEMVISAMAIDTGYREEQPYIMARENIGRVYAIKGGPHTQPQPYKANHIDVDIKGRKIKNGLQLWMVKDSYYKLALFGKIKSEEKTWFLHKNATDEYCMQVVGEKLVKDKSGKYKWVSAYKRHDYLDCEKYNEFLADMLKIKNMNFTDKGQVARPKQQARRRVINKGRVR